MPYQLILGNKAYSSWSLRAWLLFRPFEIAFEEQVVPLYTDAFDRFRDASFPARQVPALFVTQGGERAVVWDSLSIAEFLHEHHPEAGIWPSNPEARAAARSLCAEMHSGFQALRSAMPMNLRRTFARFSPDEETRADIDRVVGLWRWASGRWGDGGPYLFGREFTAADAFFAPVAARFRTYAFDLDDAAGAYRDVLLSHPATVEFYEAAQAETWVLPHVELEDAEGR